MAMYYQLVIECGHDQELATKILAHFHNQVIHTTLEQDVRCTAGWSAQEDEDGNLYCLFHVEGVSVNGFRSVTDANGKAIKEVTLEPLYLYTEQVSNWFYERLLSAPPFRHALVGWDVDYGITRSELLSREFILYNYFSGLIVNQELWQLLSKPSIFEPFKEGYYWVPKDESDVQLARSIRGN